MDAIPDFFRWLIHLIREPGELITRGGYPGLAPIIFLEMGALIVFLPGDRFPAMVRPIEIVIFVVVVLSLLPAIIAAQRPRRKDQP
jgi:hypothetical protein